MFVESVSYGFHLQYYSSPCITTFRSRGNPAHSELKIVSWGSRRWRLVFIGVALGFGNGFRPHATDDYYNFLVGVSVTDPVTVIPVTLLLVLIALAACYVPARRAMQIDPIVRTAIRLAGSRDAVAGRGGSPGLFSPGTASFRMRVKEIARVSGFQPR